MLALQHRLLYVWFGLFMLQSNHDASSSDSESPTANKPVQVAEKPAFRVAGYLPNYRLDSYPLEQAQPLTDLILFSAEAAEDGSVSLEALHRASWPEILAFKTRHRIRLTLCIGGWGRSKGFAPMAARPIARKRFAEEVLKLCLERRLDGIDLDWEHPENDAEVVAYGDLLAELKSTLQPHGILLSATIAGWQQLSPKAVDAVDWVQLMSYDHPGRHATFENALADVSKLEQLGVPKSKIVLGLPFYGRSIKNAASVRTYKELSQHPSFAPGVDEVDGFYFNGPSMVSKKAKWALDEGLGGVMVWELGHDSRDSNSLLQTIRTVINDQRE